MTNPTDAPLNLELLLREAESCPLGTWAGSTLARVLRQNIAQAARLERVQALAEKWRGDASDDDLCDSMLANEVYGSCAYHLRAALAEVQP